MIKDIERILSEKGCKIEEEILRVIPREGIENLNDGVWYHLDSGGKRIRPVLAILTCESLGGDVEKIIPFAAACELLHNWCLTKEAKILTNPGVPKSIAEIKEGDMIYTFDEKNKTLGKNRVLRVFENGTREVYEVKMRNRKVIATGDHPFLVYKKIPTIFAKLTDYNDLRHAFKKSEYTLRKLSEELDEKESRVIHWIYNKTPIPIDKVEELFDKLNFRCKYVIVHSKPYTHKLEWKKLRDLKRGELIVISTNIKDEGKPYGMSHSKTGIKLKLNKKGVNILSKHMPFKKDYLKKIGLPYKKTHSIMRGGQGTDFDTLKRIFDLYRIPPKPEYYTFSYLIKNLDLPTQTTEEFCQLVGFFLGDGFMNKNCIYFSIPKGEIRTKYTRLFEKIFGRTLKENKANECQLFCYSRPINLLMKSLNLCHNALTKYIPDWVFTLPRSQKLALVRGYLDSDGTVNGSGTIRFAGASKKLIEDLKSLVDSLGFPVSNITSSKVENRFKRGEKKETILWCLFVSNPKKILNEIGTENSKYKKRLAKVRKHTYGFGHEVPDKIINRKFFGFNPIISIKKMGTEQVFNLQVENNHNFIANNIVVHNCLVHDDIMDGDSFRRGKPTVWKKFGLAHGINIGDFMSEKVYELILRSREKGVDEETIIRLMREMVETAVKTAEGQTMDINLRKNDNPSEKDYIRMVELKTAWYFTMPIVGGAIVAGVSNEIVEKIREFGLKVGPAFQMADDLLDLTHGKGREEVGSDIKEGKRSIMVTHCINKCRPEERKKLFVILNKPREKTGREDIIFVKKLFEKYGSLEYAKNKAKSLIVESRKITSYLPENLRKILDQFADYLVERKK